MDPQNDQPRQSPSKGYGKRPLWQWIVMYVIIGSIVYFLIYLFFFHHGGGSNASGY